MISLMLFLILPFVTESSCFFSQVALTEFRSLPPLFENTPNAIRELMIASNILDSKLSLVVTYYVTDITIVHTWHCSALSNVGVFKRVE